MIKGISIDVLNGYVTLDSYMGSDSDIVRAAQVSFRKEEQKPTKVTQRRILRHLISKRHTSPFEQVEIRFKVKAPVIVWWQWVRHRTMNFNLSSGRYTELEDFYFPDTWRNQSGQLIEIDSKLQEQSEEHFLQSLYLYRELVAGGVAKEQARLLLPGFSMMYTGFVKCDLHNWLNFLRQRLAKDAQYEIRAYAEAVHDIVKLLYPITLDEWENYEKVD